MKLMNLLFCSLFFFSLCLVGQEKTLGFKGKVYAYGDPLKGAQISVIESGDTIVQSQSKGGGKFDFELEPEMQYMVLVSMEGFAAKTIWINTKGTQNLKFKVPSFGFDVYLKKEKPGPMNKLYEIPVTLIKYQPKKKEFYMDKDYGHAVKNQKRKIKESGLHQR